MAALKEAAAKGILGKSKSKKGTKSSSKADEDTSEPEDETVEEHEEAQQDELDFDDSMPDAFSTERLVKPLGQYIYRRSTVIINKIIIFALCHLTIKT